MLKVSSDPWVVAGGYVLIALGLMFAVHTCTGCSPAQQESAKAQAVYTIEEGAHSAELSKCLVDAKKDGGMEAFCVCWLATNAKYHVDAGDCR